MPFGVYDGPVVCEAAEELLSVIQKAGGDVMGQATCMAALAFFRPSKTTDEQEAIVYGVRQTMPCKYV